MTKKRSKIELLSVCVNSFDQLLQSVMHDDRAWKRTIEDIDRYDLLAVRVPRKIESKSPVVEQERFNDRKYRLWLAKELRKPLPADHWIAKIPLERSQLRDREYRVKMASILGYALYERLDFDSAAVEVRLTLAHLNAQILAECLRHSPRYSSASAVGQHIMDKFAQEEIDKLLGDWFASAFVEVEEALIASLNSRIDEIGADTQRRFAEINQRTQQKFAELEKKIHSRGRVR